MRKKIPQPNKYAKIFAIEIKSLIQNLKDRELILLLIFRLMAGWDSKQPTNFGIVGLALQDIKDNYLPTWGLTTIHNNLNKLIVKGRLKRLPDGSIEYAGYRDYRLAVSSKNIYQAEKIIQELERAILGGEKGFPDTEKLPAIPVGTGNEDFKQIRPKINLNFHRAEKIPDYKELINKFKEDIKKMDNSCIDKPEEEKKKYFSEERTQIILNVAKSRNIKEEDIKDLITT